MTLILRDCDPGHDDAVALYCAARHMNLRAITAVYGNREPSPRLVPHILAAIPTPDRHKNP